MSESVILCEGFHDRAFWAGWFTHLGCSDEGYRPGTRGFPAPDPWGSKVLRGQFAYRSRGGSFLRVVPCGGKSFILPEARVYLNQRSTKPLLRLIINVDPDVSAIGTGTGATGLRHQDVVHFIRSGFDPSATVNPAGGIEVDGGGTEVSLIRWEVTDPPGPGLPDQQTLERLVCCALVAAYPARAQAVQDWLDSRPLPPSVDPKEHAWSHMAGWYAEHGCESFYSHLWNDTRVVSELESRLRGSGAWPIVAAMAS